jgi:hypothetical protein
LRIRFPCAPRSLKPPWNMDKGRPIRKREDGKNEPRHSDFPDKPGACVQRSQGSELRPLSTMKELFTLIGEADRVVTF